MPRLSKFLSYKTSKIILTIFPYVSHYAFIYSTTTFAWFARVYLVGNIESDYHWDYISSMWKLRSNSRENKKSRLPWFYNEKIKEKYIKWKNIKVSIDRIKNLHKREKSAEKNCREDKIPAGKWKKICTKRKKNHR